MTGWKDRSAVADATARLLRDRLAHGERWIEVDGRSMLPTIAPPARVQVEAADSPRIGEVWVFVDDQGLILAHRYLRRVGDRLRFKGDGNAQPDRLVDPCRIVGRVVRAVDPRGARHVRRRSVRTALEIVRIGVGRRVAPGRPWG